MVQAYADLKLSRMETLDGWMGRRLWKAFQGLGLFEAQSDPGAKVGVLERLIGKGVDPSCTHDREPRDPRGRIPGASPRS